MLRALGHEAFANTVYINFETDMQLARMFADDITPTKLIPLIEVVSGQRITPGQTLLIFDEVQASGRALTSLKYFCELAPEYHVAAAGSLLGITIRREHYSFPVGKVHSLYLYPLTFEEFLLACGMELLAQAIREHAHTLEPLNEALHQKALELYRTYLLTGGMPEAVNAYVESHSLHDVPIIQQEILNNYTADMAKYATPADTVKITSCYRSLPAQLAKENHKFQYRVVQHGGRAATYAAAIDWLVTAGIVLPCQRVQSGQIPLRAFADASAFKLYSSDVGLLIQQAGIPREIILQDLPNIYTGAITENYVAQSLRARGYELYYWTSGQTAELDFLLQKDLDIIPVEVKKGTKVRSRSLDVYRQKNACRTAIRLSARNFGESNGLRSLPLYSVFTL